MRKILGALILAAAVSGCGAPVSEVHGTVKYNGVALKAGTVSLVASDNKSHLADIKPDGTYRVAGVARGPVRVSVIVEGPRPKPRPDPSPNDAFSKEAATKDDAGKLARMPAVPASTSPIPAKYAEAGTSGLSFELTQPVQEYSPELK